MLNNKKEFGYNYLGLYLALFNIAFKREKRFYCSEFVKQIFLDFDIDGGKILENIPIPRPIDFLDIPNTDTVYIGKLKDYI